MNTDLSLSGIHHITAVASSAADNLVFYEQVLGLRLVKRTVNFDDPYTYHFYYGDGQGSPGTIITFFPWEHLPQGRPGAGMVTAIAFGTARSSMAYWQERLASFGLDASTDERFGDPVIRFTDPSGLPLELIGIDEVPTVVHWSSGPIDPAHALTGFHSATATVNALEETHRLLVDDMGLTYLSREGNRMRFKMTSAGPGSWFDVVYDPEAPRGRPGVGTVHHIAFRSQDDEDQLRWQTHLRSRRLGVTAVRDRNYFRSIYYQTPGGVLFEIATDPPGFTVDEPIHRLGSALKLPAQYEPDRVAISQKLPLLREETFRHLYEPPTIQADIGRTLVPLHGTGGSERDLIPMARDLGQSAMAIISPRGQVLESGMPRFFRRLANNLLDEADVRYRAQEIAGFLTDAALRYGRNPNKLTALGYSNGANMAAAVMLLRPEVFASAVLLRPMAPLSDAGIPNLRGKAILMLTGANDNVIPAASTAELVRMFERSCADLTHRVMDAGHEITPSDMEEIGRWLDQHCNVSHTANNALEKKTA